MNVAELVDVTESVVPNLPLSRSPVLIVSICAQTERGDFKCDRVVADQLSFPLPPKKLSSPPPSALMPDVVLVPTKVSA
jgi:hypothetical protein